MKPAGVRTQLSLFLPEPEGAAVDAVRVQADPAQHAETLEQLEVDRKRIDDALDTAIRRIKRGDG